MHQAPPASSHEARDVPGDSRATVTRASGQRGHSESEAEGVRLGRVTEPLTDRVAPSVLSFELDLPAPLSVNRTRRIDWASKRKIDQWQRSADYAYLLQKRELTPITGRFEVIITLCNGSRIDADNTAKSVIDALRRYRLIPNDNPKHMRRVTIEFGDVEGCRATVRAIA